jgi:hypothetical protein
MAATRSSRYGTWLVLGVLAVFLVFALAFLYVGWGMADSELDRGLQMSGAGYVAMTFGIIVTLALGIGLMALIFSSNRRGHDRVANIAPSSASRQSRISDLTSRKDGGRSDRWIEGVRLVLMATPFPLPIVSQIYRIRDRPGPARSHEGAMRKGANASGLDARDAVARTSRNSAGGSAASLMSAVPPRAAWARCYGRRDRWTGSSPRKTIYCEERDSLRGPAPDRQERTDSLAEDGAFLPANARSIGPTASPLPK